ncbi:hypothetical protein FGRMN_6859 [Fusarium graminum]|nr:hypothetical protein FGRMN_6859 [Fusarium graminum]
MPAAPRKPASKWDDIKPLIIQYINTENKTLKHTMHTMETQHGFVASEKEYRHRLAKWNIRKNVPKSAWHDIDEQDISGTHIIRGVSVSSKRFKRSISRYTPKSGSKRQSMRLECDIPWFYFEQKNLLYLRLQIESIIPHLCWINPPGTPTHVSSPAEFSMTSARALLRSFFHFENNHVACDMSSQVIINLRKYMPRKLGASNDLISTEPIFLVLWSCIYLATNELLTDAKMVDFLLWVKGTVAATCMDTFITNLVNILQKNSNASTDIFLFHLLRNASNLEMEGLVRLLLKKGVSPNQSLSQSADPDRDCNWGTPLQIAIYRENLVICRLLLKHGANTHAHSFEWIMPPLFIAVSVSNLRITNALIESGSDVDCYSYEKVEDMGTKDMPIASMGPYRSALMEAVNLQHLDIARTLLEVGADVHSVSFRLGSPLHIAIRNGDVQMMQLLLEYGASLDQVVATEAFIVNEISGLLKVRGRLFTAPRFSETIAGEWRYALKVQPLLMPLQIAASHDDITMIKFLLSIGVQPRHQRLDGGRVWNQILQFPFVKDDPEVERKLMQTCMDYSGLWLQASQSALHIAARNGNVEMMRCLLESHAIVDYMDESGATALQISCGLRQLIYMKDESVADHYALQARDASLSDSNFDLDSVKLLLDWKANINFPAGGSRGRTALQAAVESGNEQLVTFLLSRGADVNSPASQIGGLTAIEAAAWTGKFTLMKTLLQAGATSNAALETTALHMAARNGYVSDFINLLETVVDIDTILKSPPISRFGGSLLQCAIHGRHPSIIQTLLDHPADVNAVFENETALCTAARAEVPEILETLLKKGADPNTIGVGETPLAIAAALKSKTMVEILLKGGACVGQLSRHPDLGYAETLGWTLWRWLEYSLKRFDEKHASRELTPDSLDIVSLLLQHGADPDKVAFSLLYPIELVAKLNDGDLLDIFLDNNANVDAPGSRPPLKWAFTFWNTSLDKVTTKESEQITREIINCSKNPPGCSVLLDLVVEYRYFTWAEQLLDDQSNIRSTFQSGSALAWACWHGQIDIVKTLLHRNKGLGNPICTDGFGCAKEEPKCCAILLQIATCSGHFNIVRLILDQGARDRACYECERTALDRAAARGLLDIAFLLLQYDEEPIGPKSRCLNAATEAASFGYHILAEQLRQYGTNPSKK